MPAVSKRQIVKVCRDAGYRVLGVEQNKHFQITAEKDGKVVKANLSITPRSSFWPTWLLADLKRETSRSH
jgi:hypothetical protein